ncbi:MAG TPA: DUF2252 family protein [Nakamurella sp.]
MTTKVIAHASVAGRRAKVANARSDTPLSSHLGWTPPADRPDPVALLEEQNTTREPDLVPVRHGRMIVSPFTFSRGAAKLVHDVVPTGRAASLSGRFAGTAERRHSPPRGLIRR